MGAGNLEGSAGLLPCLGKKSQHRLGLEGIVTGTKFRLAWLDFFTVFFSLFDYQNSASPPPPHSSLLTGLKWALGTPVSKGKNLLDPVFRTTFEIKYWRWQRNWSRLEGSSQGFCWITVFL